VPGISGRAGGAGALRTEVRREGRVKARTSFLACASMVVLLGMTAPCAIAGAGSTPSDRQVSTEVMTPGDEAGLEQSDGHLDRGPASRGTVRDHDFDKPWSGLMSLLVYLWVN